MLLQAILRSPCILSHAGTVFRRLIRRRIMVMRVGRVERKMMQTDSTNSCVRLSLRRASEQFPTHCLSFRSSCLLVLCAVCVPFSPEREPLRHRLALSFASFHLKVFLSPDLNHDTRCKKSNELMLSPGRRMMGQKRCCCEIPVLARDARDGLAPVPSDKVAAFLPISLRIQESAG